MSVGVPPDLGIPAEDWGRVPALQALVLALWKQVQELEREVARLREQLGKTSRNSSKPPSSDPPEVTKPKPKSWGRKRGAQPGHKGAARSLKPIDEVDEIVPVKPSHCRHCGAKLSGNDPDRVRHQVTEVPPVEATVTEYQLHTLCCSLCGEPTTAELPRGVPTGAFGPRLTALVGLLSGAYRLSKRNIGTLLWDCFGVELSLGSVSHLEEAVSEAVEDPVEEARGYIQDQPAVNVDETGWRQHNRKSWLWTAVSSAVSVFVIRWSRGSKVVRELVGEAFEGVVGSDRLSAYNFLPLRLRQICWAHLMRDFRAFVDRGGESAQIGNALLEQADRMFIWWYRVRDGTLKRSSFRVYMSEIRGRVGQLLGEGRSCSDPETASTCSEILKVEPALWTFVRREDVEPTNNAAERALRHGVIWRKTSFGTQSDSGSRFVERMLTVVATLRQQRRNVLDYLTEACEAALRGHIPPSLLPDKVLVTAHAQAA